MSTVAEIEKAIQELPFAQWQEIRRWMDAHPPKPHAMDWPVPPPDVPAEEIWRIQAEIDRVFSVVE